EKELHRLAHQYIRQLNPGHTLQTTAVINETYIKLVDSNIVEWQNRAHFFAIAANMMRRFLLNYIRDSKRQKRGGDFTRVEFDENIAVVEQKSDEILALEEALQKLSEFDERKARIVELRYFGGLTFEEIAEILKISEITAHRDWNFAKAWLARNMNQ
nr:ECF-type sigma factor [Pyrinomonadaceae bacterium]